MADDDGKWRPSADLLSEIASDSVEAHLSAYGAQLGLWGRALRECPPDREKWVSSRLEAARQVVAALTLYQHRLRAP